MSLLGLAVLGIADPAMAGPLPNYSLLTTIPVPPSEANVQPGGAFTSFDISFFELEHQRGLRRRPVQRRRRHLFGFDPDADRAGARLCGTAGDHLGFRPGRRACHPRRDAVRRRRQQHAQELQCKQSRGADAAVSAAQHGRQLSGRRNGVFADREFGTGGQQCRHPAFGTLVNASTGTIVHGNIVVPNAVGLEQPVWNPNTGTFFISVPSFGGGNNPGGVAEINPDGTIGRIYDFSTFGIASCSPTGLALGASGNLMVGCGNPGTQTVVLNPAGTGSIVTQIAQIAARTNSGTTPPRGISSSPESIQSLDERLTWSATRLYSVLQAVGLPPVNAHSITVDPLNSNVFVPLEGTTATATDDLCPLGCIAVFAQTIETVREPSSLAIMLVGFAGLAGLGSLSRARRFGQRRA